jgi:phosphoribosylanthranilate isomerase
MWLKICGMTSPDAVTAALQARVDAIGFVFSPSVRRLEPEQAAQLAAPARGRVSLVAVTVHPEQQLVDDILRVFNPDVLQTDLQDFDSLTLPDTLARLPVLRAGVGSGAALPRRLLFEGARSGSGEAADWNTASRLARMSELILAGGLNAHNVAAAIRAVRPHGVDVSSGVESAPGRKSAQLMAEFVEAARAAFQGMANDER